LLAGLDDPGHHRLDRVGAVAGDQRLDLRRGEGVRGDRRAQVHLHHARQPRLAQEHLLQVGPDPAPLDHVERRETAEGIVERAGGWGKMSGASTQKLPTTEPPMSEWCSTFATQQNSWPAANTGAATIVSGWCGVPTYGSLDKNMSPGPMPGSELRFSRIHRIV